MMKAEKAWKEHKSRAIETCKDAARKWDRMADRAKSMAQETVNPLTKQPVGPEYQRMHRIREDFYRSLADEARAKATHVETTWPDNLFAKPAAPGG